MSRPDAPERLFANKLNQFYLDLRALWNQDFLLQLRRLGIIPGASGIPAGALPPGTMINRGAYTGTALYRPGDLVIDGGAAYVALLASQGVPTSDATRWQPLGATASDGQLVLDEHGNVVVDEDGEIVTTG